MAATRTKRSAASALGRLLWRAPLLAIPFALFFGVLMGRGLPDYLMLYKLAAVFAYVNALALWAAEYFLMPALQARKILPDPTPRGAATIFFSSATVVSSAIAAILCHLFVVPGFLGSFRAVVLVTMFTLLFLALMTGIQLAIFYYRQSLERARAEQEILLARRIQRSFLLTDFPDLPRLDIYAFNLASREVSGDFYDVVPAGDGAWLLAIADVSGKGVPAALLTSMLQASLRTQAGITGSVSDMLANMNRLAYRSTAVSQFATFFLARVEPEPPRLRYSNAGHNHPVLQRASGKVELLDRGGVVVGILEDARFEEASLPLAAGDLLVLYTDGVSEAESPSGEMFGEERLLALISALPRDTGARETVDRIVAEVQRHLGGRDAGDDITLMAVRVR